MKRKDHAVFELSALFKNNLTPQQQRYTSNSKGHRAKTSSTSSDISPTAAWPPEGLNYRSRLTFEDAKALIASGALNFEGCVAQAAHTIEDGSLYYAFADIADGTQAPRAEDPRHFRPEQSLVLGIIGVKYDRPWETLEQPSMALCFGDIRGGVTLNRYISSINEAVDSADPPLSPVTRRELPLRKILCRLHYLQGGLDDDVSPNTCEQSVLC